MSKELLDLLYGALGGGIVAAVIRLFEAYWVSPRLGESIESRKKLFQYAKPLWLDCNELELRLKTIQEHRSVLDGLEALKWSPKDAHSLEWYAKGGYFIISTAYLIACVAAWIVLYQQDVVFLQFGRRSLTTQFFRLIQSFKVSISSQGSILYYYYVDGIGERLVQPDQNKPMPFSSFCFEMYTNQLFREYYDQLIQFLNRVAWGEYMDVIDTVVEDLKEIKRFLKVNGIVPELLPD